MDTQQTDETEKVQKRNKKKQRALNALVFLLTVAVCVQGLLLWETNEKLNATVADLDNVRQMADNSDWKVVPRPSDPDDASMPQSNDPQSQAALPALPDPLDQLGASNWDPFSDMDRMRQEIDRLMGRVQSPGTGLRPQAGNVSRMVRGPGRTSINNDGDTIQIKAYLPGADAADISVSVEGQVLSISVKQEQNASSSNGARVQRMSGAMTQRLTLPEAVDGAGMKTTFKDDVLTIVIPKAGKAGRGATSDPSQSVRN